jgi:hypothetical protein
MTSWRDELIEATKSKAERDTDEDARKKKRLEEALSTAAEAMRTALEGLRFASEQLKSKSQPVTLDEKKDHFTLTMRDLTLDVALSRKDAVLKVTFNDGRPREFDFAKDRHLAPKDVEEYVGRRAVELARAAQKANPW